MKEMINPVVEDVMNTAMGYIHDDKSLALIRKAAEYAREHHSGQFRRSGEPYFIHLENVAYILATLHGGPSTIAAGFLHDVIEDCGVSRDELAAEFSPEIADLVDAVSKVSKLEYKGKDDPEYQAANHRKIFIATAKDVRVILIKLADRLHNMRTLQFQSEKSQKRIASETLDVYAPIAHRLGISAIKNELEDRSFYYLNRDEYKHIAALVEQKKTERDASVSHMISEIKDMLHDQGLDPRIFGRSKHLYSIYNKMVKKNKRFEEILDLLAIRIVTQTELNCYEILGYIHARFKPLSGRLKDYIAVPKTNMYQSIHTTIVDENGRIFEVQIRTEDMDAVAERGVAAHWRYKEGSKYDAKREQKEIEEKLGWFKNLVSYSEDQKDASPSEYMESLQHDVFEANVYVMTPKGRVIDLPSGSTPIDFAYRIHTDIGHTTIGAIVNGVMVPLNTELHTGEVVQIRTRKGSGPSEDWLKFIKTNQARNKIRNYLQKKETEEKEKHVDEGEKFLFDELTRRGFDPKEFMEKKKYENIYRDFAVSNYIDFMYGIAVKSINVINVCEKLTNQKARVAPGTALKHVINRTVTHTVNSKTGLIVDGIPSMKVDIAHCCLPVKDDEIVGFIAKGSGVKVHRADCPNIAGGKQRTIKVSWNKEDKTEHSYDADLIIRSSDRTFLLTDIATVIAQCKAPLLSVNSNVNRATLTATTKITISVHNLEHLQNVIANLRKVSSILSVDRAIH